MVNRETVETVADFIFLGSKITVDGDCSHEIKRCLLLGRKAVTNLDSILKNRDITLPTKVCLVKAIIFPVVMYGCESWTLKKAECRRIDAFELWCWKRLLRVPWTAKSSNQSILKEISPECSLEGLMLKLKLQYSATWIKELTHSKRPWFWERLRAGREGNGRGWDGLLASPTRGTWVWVHSWSWWWTGTPGMLWSMGSQRVGHDLTTELNCTESYSKYAFASSHFASRHFIASLAGSHGHVNKRRVTKWKLWWIPQELPLQSKHASISGLPSFILQQRNLGPRYNFKSVRTDNFILIRRNKV